MSRGFSRQLFSVVFLFVFFIKMMISATPLIFAHTDSKAVNSVIMQLEIENNSEKGGDTLKETNLKDFYTNYQGYKFSSPIIHLSSAQDQIEDDKHIRSFYPAVPTPPPNV